MRILITGGTGFVGEHVLKKISRSNNQILALTRSNVKSFDKNIKFLKCDLSSIKTYKKELSKFKPDAAIHLAWQGIPNYNIENSLNNLNQGIELINILIAAGCKKIIAAGTLWEYGTLKGKVAESTIPVPHNIFTATKNSLNLIGKEICREKNVEFIWARIFYVYGPGQRRDSLIPYLIDCLYKNTEPEIRNPEARNDFVYVEDVADAIFKLLIKKSPSGDYNIGSGKLTSIKHIISQIYKGFYKKQKYLRGRKHSMDFINGIYADTSKINKVTGWIPKTTIDSGIGKTIESFGK